MGRRPKPPEIKELEGNPGKRAIPRDRLKASGPLTKPDHLGEYAAEVWDRITGAMPPALYTACDRELLSAYCEAADLHRRAVLAIRQEGEISHGEGGAPYQNPWISLQNRSAALLGTLGSRLGLDPAARAGLSMPRDAPASKFAGLIALPGGRGAPGA